jgi:DNA-binding transcriptional MerR regulator
MKTELTIQEVAKRTGLSIDTLRYYERIELLEPIKRDQSGHRRYTQADLNSIDLLLHLRNTGMPLAEMAHLAQLRRQGFAATLTERRLLYEQYQHTLQQHMQQLEQRMTVLENKIAHLKELEAQQGAEPYPAHANSQSEAAERHGNPETNKS